MVTHGRRHLGGTWAAVVHIGDGAIVAVDGDVPPAAWVVAFIEGSRASRSLEASDRGPDDVVWSPMPASGLAFVVGRDSSGFRSRERRQVASLARIGDTRVVDFVKRSHPSASH